jgi:orotidine-5'-phosphate decarboxylase
MRAAGEAMLRAAREAVASVTKPPLLIGVTILTSLDEESIARVGFAGSVRENVERLARLTKECGLDGVVCSAQEAPWVRAAAGSSFSLVTPGIRLATDAKGDQVRTVTPAEAVKLGADYLVIGRPDHPRRGSRRPCSREFRRELGLSQEAA